MYTVYDACMFNRKNKSLVIDKEQTWPCTRDCHGTKFPYLKIVRRTDYGSQIISGTKYGYHILSYRTECGCHIRIRSHHAILCPPEDQICMASIFCPVGPNIGLLYIFDPGPNRAAIFGPGPNVAATFGPGPNVPILKYKYLHAFLHKSK